jgi:TPR repeat protein
MRRCAWLLVAVVLLCSRSARAQECVKCWTSACKDLASYLPKCEGKAKKEAPPSAGKSQPRATTTSCRDATSCVSMCEAGNSVGCLTLASMYENGIGVAADAGRARRFYQRACELGAQRGCDAARAMAPADTQAEPQRPPPPATPQPASRAPHAPVSMAQFKRFLGVNCGDTEAALTAAFGKPSSRTEASTRAMMTWNDIGVSVQTELKSGHVAFMMAMLAGRKKAPPGNDPNARYIGADASTVIADFGAPESPGDAIMYQDQKNKVMVSFNCPGQHKCDAVLVYCLGE